MGCLEIKDQEEEEEQQQQHQQQQEQTNLNIISYQFFITSYQLLYQIIPISLSFHITHQFLYHFTLHTNFFIISHYTPISLSFHTDLFVAITGMHSHMIKVTDCSNYE